MNISKRERKRNVGNVRLIVRPAVIFFRFVHKSIKNLPDFRMTQLHTDRQTYDVGRRDMACGAALFILVALIFVTFSEFLMVTLIYTRVVTFSCAFSFSFGPFLFFVASCFFDS